MLSSLKKAFGGQVGRLQAGLQEAARQQATWRLVGCVA
jgi:hypothetical protein